MLVERRESIRWHLLVAPLALVLGMAGALSFALLSGPSPKPALPGGVQESPASHGYLGTLVVPARTAPQIDLRNYLGERVTLSSYRGRAVLVTFLYTKCVDVCPLITSNLRVVLNELGPAAGNVAIVAVSVDPRGDTRAAVADFLQRHGMTGRMQYLVGSGAELARTWSAWGVGAKREVDNPELVSHTALVYGVSAQGRLTTIYPALFRPEQIVHDVPKLAAR